MNDFYNYVPSITNYEAEIKKDAIKNINRKDIQLDYEIARELQRQKISEKRKKQVEVVTVLEDGRVTVETQNLDFESKERYVCNFTHPHLTRLMAKGDAEIIWAFECEVSARHVVIYLKDSKVGDPEYLLTKFNAKGCEVYSANRKAQKDYLVKIWTAVYNKDENDVLIAEHYGWWIDEEGQMQFIDDSRVIWEDVKKWAE